MPHDQALPHLSPRRHKVVLWGVIVLLLMAAVYGGWRYVTRQWNAEQVIRRSVIPQLEAQLGKTIEVQDIESNYLSWVRLRQVTVGRNAKLPGGALFTAKEIDIQLNIPALVLGRSDVLGAISSVTVRQPQLYVERSNTGAFNLSSLFSAGLSSTSTWTGTIRLRDGVLIYQDNAIRNSSDQALNVTFQGFQGDVRFDGNKPVVFDAGATKVLLNNSVTLPQFNVAGTASPQGDWVQSTLNTTLLPASILTDYLFGNKLMMATRGFVRGTIHLNWNQQKGISYNGTVQLEQVNGRLDASLVAAELGALPVSDAHGTVKFDAHTVTLRGLELQAKESPLTLNGTLVYGDPVLESIYLDFKLQSPSFQYARWSQWLKPILPEGTQFQAASGKIDLRVTGNADRLKTSGSLTASQAVMRQKDTGSFSAARLAADWDGAIFPGKSLQANLAVQLKGSGAALSAGQVDLQTASLQGDLQFLWTPKSTFKAQLHLGQLQANSGGGEKLQSASVNVTLLHRKSTFVQFVGTENSITSQQLGNVKAQHAWLQARIDSQNVELQGQLQDYELHSARYGDAPGELLHFTAAKQLPIEASSPWRGAAAVKNLDLGHLRLAAFAPQLAEHAQNSGRLSGSAFFVWDAQNPQISGQFQLSHLTLLQDQQKVLLQEINSSFRYDQDQLVLSGLHARSPYGNLEGQLAVDLDQGGFDLLVLAPQARFDARELNPFLKGQQMKVQGIALGKMWLSASSQDNPGIHAKFDLQLSASKVLLPEALRFSAQNVHVRGQVEGNFESQKQWQFETQVSLAAEKGTLSQDDNLARLGTFRLSAHGDITHKNGKLLPELQGRFESAALKLQTADLRQPLALAKVHSQWQWWDNALEMPRLAADYARGSIEGHLTLSHFNRASPTVRGELLARNLQMSNVAKWFQKANPDALQQVDVTGTGFIKATLGGTADKLSIDLAAQLYNGQLQWYDDGAMSRIPLDIVRLKTQLLVSGNQQQIEIPLEEFLLWSAGSRLKVQGDVQYLSNKSTFSYDVDVALDGLKLASTLQHWPLPTAVKEWQQSSGSSGVLNARLHLTGQGTQPQIEGSLGLPLGRLYDVDVRDVKAAVQATWKGDDAVLRLANIQGSVARSPFTANVAVNSNQQLWTVSADIEELPAFELLNLSEQLGPSTEPRDGTLHLSKLPLRGSLKVHLAATGSLASQSDDAAGILDGVLQVSSPQLSWHGEPLGALTADFKFTPDLVKLQKVTLESTDPQNPRLVQLSGDIPWNAQSTALEAYLNVQNVRLSFLTLLLDQTKQLWRRTGNGEIWQQLQQWKRDLPPGTEGRVSLNAKLDERLASPRLVVSDFKVRDASARSPGLWGKGPLHPLPNVDAAGSFEDGVLTITQFEARLPSESGDQEDLVIHTLGTARIDPNGTIDLGLELLHGHLNDLALWISALRNADGSSALSGEVGQVVLNVQGSIASPQVTGSFLAKDVSFHDYTVDRLRITRFDIKNDQLLIRPGNFTVVKGAYQSSTGWGLLPWSWGNETTPLGLMRDAPMEVHLPLKNEDFGALLGVFLPAVTSADASAFRGALDIKGTIENPQLNGIISIEGGQLALSSQSAALQGGITGLTGTLRFVDGHILKIDAVDPLRGKLVSASAIKAPQTGNRTKSTFRERPGGEPSLGGNFQLSGQVALDLKSIKLTAERRNLSSHHYDLQLMLQDASFSNQLISGVRHANLGVIWETGSGDPAHQQHLRWMLQADGVDQKGDLQGQLLGFGAFTLDPEFAASTTELLRVHSEPFTNAADFSALGIAKARQLFTALPPDSIEGKTGYFQLKNYGVAIKDVGNGILNGKLNLQNSDNGNLRITGDVTLSDSELNALPQSLGSGRAVVWPNAPLMNIQFELGEDVRFSTSNLKATLGGYLHVSGTPFDPLLLGTFDILRGRAIFPGTRARITEGQISVTARREQLTGQMQVRTEIDATAEGRNGRYLITLHLHGPLNADPDSDQQLLVEISSDPPLSRDEAFSQLLGTSVFNSENGGNDEAYARLVLNMLSGPLFSGIESTLADALGLTSITLNYQLNQPIGIEVGKAIGDDLYLSYRRSLGKNPGEPTPYEFRLEYRIKGGLELGLKLNERNDAAVTLQKSWRF